MKLLRAVYHFLGSIYLAIGLIAFVALFVIAGTLLESTTSSHRYAAYFTYSNPLFIALLWGFFINILVSALRRWPFKWRHVPFLITHLGLLMILGGVLMKSYFGLQGTMSIIEGSGSELVTIPDTYFLHIEKKDLKDPTKILSDNYPLSDPSTNGAFSDLQIKVVDSTPNSKESPETWIKEISPKQKLGFISGLKPFPVHNFNQEYQTLPYSAQINLHSLPCNILAGYTEDIPKIAQQAYLQGLNILLKDAITEEVVYQGPLEEALKGIQWPNGRADIKLNLNYTKALGFEHPELLVEIATDRPMQKTEVTVPLQGAESLLNQNKTPYLGKFPITIDLLRSPSVALLQDPDKTTYLFAFDQNGQVHVETSQNESLPSLIMYDKGFGGYAVQAHLPFSAHPAGRKERESALTSHLTSLLKNTSVLPPPLQLFKNACKESDQEFASCFMDFLSRWNYTYSWLYPENAPLSERLEPIFKNLNWDAADSRAKNGCVWLSELFTKLEPDLKLGMDPLSLIQQMGWPLVKPLQALKKSEGACTAEESHAVLTAFTQQMLFAGHDFPEIYHIHMDSAADQARLFSAYLRAYEIHLCNMIGTETHQKHQNVTLECPLSMQRTNQPPSKKLEENTPKIILQLKKGARTEFVSLTYDRAGKGLKWPVFGGEYLLRFQPEVHAIPHHIRLRHARQVNYPNSNQPFSYESDLLISDMRNGNLIEKTISMNHVHETWDGYRFYLANIAPQNETAVKYIQLAVNHDPAKYLLTYPGALVLTLGVLLLFWMGRFAP